MVFLTLGRRQGDTKVNEMGEESVITSERRFRRATMADLPTMLKIYEHARKLMASNGNPTQWGDKFPREEVVRDDVESQRTVLLVDTVDGEERVLAQFALCPGIDPTYVNIDGAWLDDDPYVTIPPDCLVGSRQGCGEGLHQLVHRTLRQCARGYASQQQGYAACARIELVSRAAA